MKLVGASIMTLAAALLIVGGAHAPHWDTGLFVMIIGSIVGLIGLAGWFAALKEKS
jgi:hypothetical protein